MIGRKSFLMYLNKIISAVTGALGMFFIARFMQNPSYNYGVVSFALSFVSIFTIISTFFNKAHRKRISGKEPEAECMGTYLSLHTFATALMIIFVFGALWSWENILGRGFQSPLHRDVIYIILLFKGIDSLWSIARVTFIGKREIAKSEVLTFVNQSVPTIFIIYVAISGGGAIELALTYVAGALLALLIGIFFLIDVEIKKPNWRLAKRYWEFSWPSFTTKLFSKFGNRVDVVMVQLFWSSVNVGYYAAARRFSLLTTGMAASIATVMFPSISNMHANGDIEKIKSTVKVAMRYISMLSMPVIAFILFFPDRIIYILLSGDFLPAVPVLRILAFQGFIASYFKPMNQIIPGMDKPKVMMKVGVTANLINITLNVILIPDSLFGVPLIGLKEIGAATATLTAAIVSSVLGYYIVDDMIDFKIPKNPIYHISSATITGFSLYTLHRYVLPITRFYHLFGYGLAMLGIYTGILYLVGEFTKEDWNYIMETIHPGELWRYIKDELTGKDSDKD
ncbi:MAG: oligosaccharide flippase family protein [Thermoplasmatota archaeon]